MKAKQTRTAGGVVVGPSGHILIVNQRGRKWSLPKGGVEKNESDLDAAKREIGEESGVDDLQLLGDLGSYKRYRMEKDGSDDKSEHKTIVIFLFRTAQKELAPRDPDNPEARWVPREEVGDMLTHRKDKKFFRRILTRIPSR